jgi:PAS domain S-box-containing protein
MKDHLIPLFRNTLARYLFSVGVVASTFVLRMWFIPLTGTGAPFVLFFAAVLAISLLLGIGPGIVAVILSMPLAAYSFVMRAGYPPFQAVFQALLFSIDGGVVVYLTYLMKKGREAIKRSEARTLEIIEFAPDAFFHADLSARFTDVNHEACRMLRYSRDELVGKTIFDIIPADDAPRLRAVRDKLLVPGQVERAEWILIRKDGTTLPVEVSAHILSDGRWQAFVRDITERKEVEVRDRRAREQLESAYERLRESEERFRLTFEEAPIGMALVELDGRFVRVNRVLCEIVGYSPDELTKRTFQDITHPEDLEADVAVARRLSRGEIPRYQFGKRYIRKDGSIVDVVLSVSVLRSPGGAPLYFISRIEDVSERKRAEEALQRAVAARDLVLGIVVHDLRNPLSNIIMACSTLKRHRAEPERRNQKPIETISRSAYRMNRLIEDLLDVTLVEAGQLKIECDRLSPTDVIVEAVEMQASLASGSGVEVHLAVGHGVEEVWADRDRLLQVLENLIGNAVKFTTPGGQVTVGTDSRDHEVVFRVADTGCGIASESLSHVFDRFWQATSRAGRLGAGLGLPITKGIVEAHGGRIWVESVAGRGSTFFFTIPKASQTKAA